MQKRSLSLNFVQLIIGNFLYVVCFKRVYVKRVNYVIFYTFSTILMGCMKEIPVFSTEQERNLREYIMVEEITEMTVLRGDMMIEIVTIGAIEIIVGTGAEIDVTEIVGTRVEDMMTGTEETEEVAEDQEDLDLERIGEDLDLERIEDLMRREVLDHAIQEKEMIVQIKKRNSRSSSVSVSPSRKKQRRE
eukprot:TRINITY_DN925_c0_g1_i4.p2 TRINITY_DN925_c0_g1~~TRINITY_DN925_c0_g1_i4.p2  ORF type:complete len:190 (+),score=38.63 TRINITY_DN925_c0_g1_i4:105-674(+)